MASNDDLNQHRFVLNTGTGEIPALGFGTSLSDNTKTRNAVRTAVEVGFRHLDAAERYRNEAEVGAALKELFAEGTVRREDLFVTTKLWNNNHRPERVKPALQASLHRLGARRRRPVFGAHTVCVPARRRPRSPSPGRGGDLRRRSDVRGDLGSDGSPCRRGTCHTLSACPTSGSNAPERSSTPLESSRRSWRWSHTHTTRNGSSMNCARRMGSSCWRSRRWATRSNHDCWTTLSSSRSPSVLKRLPPKCFWPGAFSAAPQFSRDRSHPRASGRTSTVTELPASVIQEINERLDTRIRFNSVADGGEPGFKEVPSDR